MATIVNMKASDIPVGQGVVIEAADTQYAIYNDGHSIIVMDNSCTHAGCVTQWNAAARAWDCPCHGSRFNPDGTVKKGPAREPLARVPAKVIEDEIRLES